MTLLNPVVNDLENKISYNNDIITNLKKRLEDKSLQTEQRWRILQSIDYIEAVNQVFKNHIPFKYYKD